MPFDTYSFRIRADHTDGTVSDYSGGEATPLGITAPNITASPQDYYGSYFIELDWQPAVSPAGLTATSYNLQWHGSGDVGQGWTNIPDPSSGMGFDIGQAQTGEFRLQAVFADNTATEWGYSGTVAEGGGFGVPVSAGASAASDTEIDLTFNCDPQTADNSPVYYEIVYAPYDAPVGSGTSFTLADSAFAPGASGGAQITGLTPGTHYDFLVVASWHGQTEADESGGASANVDATTMGTPPNAVAAPAAPAFAKAVYDPSVSGGQIDLAWANSSNDETNFEIYLETTNGNGSVQLVPIKETGADATTAVLHPKTNGPWEFVIYAKNQSGLSNNGASVTCQAIGGPDITAHLLAIQSALTAIASTPAGLAQLTKDFHTLSISGQLNLWDIDALAQDNVTTAQNSGVLPSGDHTVTVAGNVYIDHDVNYWLYGVWARLIGANYGLVVILIIGHTRLSGDTDAKLDWFDNGYLGSFNFAGPAIVDNAAPAPPPPSSPLAWHAGSYSGTN